jgi:hypothetical protein
MYKVASAEQVKDTSIFGANNPGFRADFDEKPFEFTHCFTASHPSFQLPRLRRLIENPVTRSGAYYDAGEIGIGQRWDTLPERPMTLEETFDRLNNAGAWILLKRVEQDPEYNELLDQCLTEVKKLSGRAIDEDKKKQEAIIFITSPNRVTSYHLDRECNFLMQVSGEKEISVFDRNDRLVTPEEELETFWSKDNNAGVYKPQYQDHAMVFQMRPGTGVHIPVNSPHWLKNGDNISISFSISYQYKDARRKYVYQANYYLRKFGFNPTPPGKSALLDNFKRVTIGAGLKGAKVLRRVKS